MAEPKTAESQNYEFQAEIRQLLDILTHSLYTHRDIFIRELISNAADALDKARFKSVKGEEISDPELAYSININLDEKKKTFTITDSGVGMTKDELVSNIGTIARSGTFDFIKNMSKDAKDINLIGKFGVGFYSVFMAGENVEITTKSANKNEPAWIWTSDGKGAFSVKPGPENTKRGTSILVHLRDDAKEFAEKHTVESTIKKYSNFVPFPIYIDNNQVNRVSAIWREPKSSIKDDQYNEFFKFIANETDEPLTRLHLSADVPIQFHSLLFVPKKNRELLGFGKDDEGIHLFVRRVLVDAHADDIFPDYLRFIRGVMDSDDLPINISRETLQDNPYLIKIKNTMITKFLSHLKTLAEKEPDVYQQFWKEHGRVFKEGYQDFANKDKIIELYRFNSSKCKDSNELISLSTYVERMHEKQDEIYYISGQSREAIEKNPNVEIFKAKEVEVLYCYDPIDEFALPGVLEYKDKKLVSADQANITKISNLPSKEEKKEEKDTPEVDHKELKNLARRVKDILGEKVEDVILSERLVDSPAVLVGTTPGMSSQMERIMHMMDQDKKPPKRNMEINRNHPLILDLLKIYQKDSKSEFMVKIVNRLFDTVLLLDGYVDDPHGMAKGVQELLTETTEMYMQDKAE